MKDLWSFEGYIKSWSRLPGSVALSPFPLLSQPEGQEQGSAEKLENRGQRTRLTRYKTLRNAAPGAFQEPNLNPSRRAFDGVEGKLQVLIPSSRGLVNIPAIDAKNKQEKGQKKTQKR